MEKVFPISIPKVPLTCHGRYWYDVKGDQGKILKYNSSAWLTTLYVTTVTVYLVSFCALYIVCVSAGN